MRPGASWTYRASDGSTYTLQITSVTGDLNQATATLVNSDSLGAKYTQKVVCGPDGLFLGDITWQTVKGQASRMQMIYTEIPAWLLPASAVERKRGRRAAPKRLTVIRDFDILWSWLEHPFYMTPTITLSWPGPWRNTAAARSRPSGSA